MYEESVILMIICLDPGVFYYLILKDPALTSLFCTRIILTAVLITAKFNNDIFFANNYIASVGGVTLQHLNELE